MSFTTGVERNAAILDNSHLPDALRRRVADDPGPDWCEIREDVSDVTLTVKTPDGEQRMRVAVDGDLYSAAVMLDVEDMRRMAHWILANTGESS